MEARLSYLVELFRSWQSRGLAVAVVVGFILGACATREPSSMSMPTPTTAPSSTAAVATAPPSVGSYVEIDVPDAGVRLEVPASWQRAAPDWAWSASEEGLPRVGVAWQDLEPAQEPEAALLPSPAQVLSSEPVELAWGSGRLVTLEIYAPGTEGGDDRAPLKSIESHVLVVLDQSGTRRAYDLYLAAGSADQLAALEPVLQHLLDSAILVEETAAATPVSEGAVPAVEDVQSALASSLVRDPTGLCEWEVLGLAGREIYVWAVCESANGSATSAPAVVTLSAGNKVASVQLPRDGANYGTDIRRMFPPDVQERILAGEFDAPAAMARIAARRAEDQDGSKGGGETVAVTIYFGNSQLNPGILDCSLVFPVVRLIPAPRARGGESGLELAEATLEELFAGPSAVEKEQGYVSTFSAQTASILRDVHVEDGTAYVDLADIRQLNTSAGTSCGSQAFLAEVGETVQAALPVDRVIYAIEGDPAAFYDWMQFGCSAANDFCDPSPFQQDGG